jgi:hypothetical protein
MAETITGLNTTITDAVYISENWSPLVLRSREQKFVAAKLFERRDGDVKVGDKVYFPISSLMTAQAFVEGESLFDKLNATTELNKSITIDQYYVAPFFISDLLKLHSKYDQWAEEMWAAGQGIADAIDTDILAESSNFTNAAVGTAGNAITNLTLVSAKETLDVLDVPSEERFWILDPRCEADLLNLTGNYFTSIDFANEKSLIKGQVGRIILGSPAYFTTNLPTGTTGSPAATSYRKNIYAHKQAIGVAMQKNVETQSDYRVDKQGTLGNVRAVWGVGTLRPDHGVIVNGR